MENTEVGTSIITNPCNTISNFTPSPNNLQFTISDCPSNLNNLDHTVSNLDHSTLFSFDDSFLQFPEFNASPDPTFDQFFSEATNPNSNDGENTQTQVPQAQDICLDNVEHLFNFDDMPNLTEDPFSTDSECYFTDSNCNDLVSSSKSIVPSNVMSQMSQVASDQYGLLQGQPSSTSIGYEIQQVQQQNATQAYIQQQQEALISYQRNYEMFVSSLMEWVTQQPDPQCQSCQLMRKIVHSNGFQDTQLEVHCHEGQNFHAVFRARTCNFGNECQPNPLPQMIHLPRGNEEYMKQFLMQYSMLRAKEGFALRYDSVMVNTEAGMQMSTISDTCFPKPLLSTPLHHLQKDFNGGQLFGKPALTPWTAINPTDPPASKSHKSSVAAQRERTGRLQLSDCAQYFHLPINEAAKQMEICPTVLKKICRRNGLPRWPHRKIKSIERMIATLEQTIADGNGEGAESIRNEIVMLKNQRARLCGGYLPLPK